MHEISIIIVLQKSTHGWSTLQVCRSGGVGALLSVSAFNYERVPM